MRVCSFELYPFEFPMHSMSDLIRVDYDRHFGISSTVKYRRALSHTHAHIDSHSLSLLFICRFHSSHRRTCTHTLSSQMNTHSHTQRQRHTRPRTRSIANKHNMTDWFGIHIQTHAHADSRSENAAHTIAHMRITDNDNETFP